MIGGEDFETSIGQGEQIQGRVMGGLPSVWMVNVFEGRGLKMKEEKEYEKKN